jgi:hypothetical protein
MTAPLPETMDRAFEAICMLLMPFFLIGAGDDPEKARTAVADLLRGYDPASVQELDLAARIVGFSAAALDNLRLSIAGPDRPDTKILRFRANAVSLSRSAEQCRTTLKTIQAERPQPVAQAVPARLLTPLPPMTAAKIEKAKSEARDMLAGLARLGAAPGQGMTAIRIDADPGAQIAAAVAAAFRGSADPASPAIPPR